MYEIITNILPMDLPLSDLVFQNNGSGQMCHVLGHGNSPKKQQQN